MLHQQRAFCPCYATHRSRPDRTQQILASNCRLLSGAVALALQMRTSLAAPSGRCHDATRPWLTERLLVGRAASTLCVHTRRLQLQQCEPIAWLAAGGVCVCVCCVCVKAKTSIDDVAKATPAALASSGVGPARQVSSRPVGVASRKCLPECQQPPVKARSKEAPDRLPMRGG